jgi:hypothetical protein
MCNIMQRQVTCPRDPLQLHKGFPPSTISPKDPFMPRKRLLFARGLRSIRTSGRLPHGNLPGAAGIYQAPGIPLLGRPDLYLKIPTPCVPLLMAGNVYVVLRNENFRRLI